jgi:WD40 repeat protein
MLLSELPAEILYLILAHLPTVNALAILSQTCHRLNKIITGAESVIFREFVQTRFPAIETPPFWKDAAQALTSRSRALYRRGIIARFVVPSNTTKIGHQRVTPQDNSTLGYRPVIDSYEIWNGQSWADRKEVLAWGAGNQLVMRIKQNGSCKQQRWLVFDELDAVSIYDDIRSLHLLSSREQYKNDTDVEHLIFSRARGDITHLVISPYKGTYEHKQKFKTNRHNIEQTDLSIGANPTLAAHLGGGSIAFYHAETDKEENEPFISLSPAPGTFNIHTKLLSSSMVAVGTGTLKNSLSISQFTPAGVSLLRSYSLESHNDTCTVPDMNPVTHREAMICAIEPLGAHSLTGGSPGEVFLTAWAGHSIRLHDLRSPESQVNTYTDNTDSNPIYSLLAFGHDSFLVGSGGEGLVKVFDLRMGKTSSYLDTQMNTGYSYRPKPQHHPKYGFSMFLSIFPPPTFPDEIAPRANRNRQRGSYRGPVYTMSSPSPSSPTVYTGIENGVVQLDFASTDDLLGSNKDWYERNLALDVNTSEVPLPDPGSQVLNLTGYERPDPDDFTTTSKLRHQREFWKIEPEDIAGSRRHGLWDSRWEEVEEPGSWRSRAS